jgi:hypothetical protein
VKVTLKTSEAARRDVSQLFLEIRDLVDGLERGTLLINMNDSSYVASRSDCLRITSQILAPGPLKNMLLKCMLDAESESAGGAFVFLKCLITRRSQDLRLKHENNRFTISDLENSLINFSDRRSAKIAIESVKRAGRDGKIVLDKAEAPKTEIIFGSQQCSWRPSQDFFSCLKSDRVSVNSPKLIFIDGIIESVAECHRIFQDSNESMTPYIIFARGFSGDVITTSAANVSRGTAHVIPVEVPYDEVGCNALADLATGFSTDVGSSLKGELISGIDLGSCPKIERATCYLRFTELESLDNNMPRVVSHLSEKIKNCSSAEEDILRRRMSSLGAGTLTIRVGKDNKSLSGVSRDRIDFCIRHCVSAFKGGMSQFLNEMHPSLSIESGKKAAISFLEIISSNGAILGEDKLCG